MRTMAIAILLAMTLSAEAEPRHRHKDRNYILRRQSAGAVRGVPTMRRIIGKREIDIYPNGLMFEKDNLIGVKR